jgi:hypothetical protein
MKFKFNWGVGIAIFYVAFVLATLGTVIFSTFQRTDLVEDNYYEKELKYQEKIESQFRTKELEFPLELIQGASTIAVKFPEYFKNQNIKGVYHFYKPSNSSYDKKITIALNDDSFQTIDTRNFQKGFWRLKIDWMAGDSAYYMEKTININ